MLNTVFAKLIALILFAVSFIIPGSPDNVDISAEAVAGEAQIIRVEWKNNTGKAITVPKYYIEKYENEEWTAVEFSDGFGFPEIYTQYYPTEGGTITIDAKRDLKEPLTAGTYRITLCYNILYSSVKTGSSCAEFTVN